MIEKRLEELGINLQGKKPHLPHFLSAIRLDGIRGFNNLRVPFDYPVSVIAGGNTTGKSTVLFATACAYKVPGAGVKEFVPSTLFPDFKLLCEDDIAEGILEGIFDFLLPNEGMNREAIRIGRDTGASQFPIHAETLRKFGQIQNTVFVLDGDQRDGDIALKIQNDAKYTVSILFLPGNGSPESWVWDRLKYIPDTEIERLGNTRAGLSNLMNRLDAIYSSASDSPSEIAKNKFRSLSDNLRREASEICRIVSRLEADQRESDIRPLTDELQGILRQWRE